MKLLIALLPALLAAHLSPLPAVAAFMGQVVYQERFDQPTRFMASNAYVTGTPE